ncbi:PilC/PilY family type IV pilus protein [Lysobacter sp. TAF61]|uniref:PilC/PilY family type IV pilus protein n=1 Tax=Lysobacter sp. TAF61 TaxID=3233072 RepID=UPI003F94C84E
MTLHTDTNRKRAALRGSRSRFYAVGLGFMATLAGLPGHAALVIPPTPLQSASPVPPNIMFILDDSGSMEETTMPDDPARTSPVRIESATYTLNTLSYKPSITYTPWKNAAGTTLTGGTAYDSAYSDLSLASGTTTNLGNSVQTFYVPKSAAVETSTATADFYRFQILTDGTIYRSEYLDGTAPPALSLLSQGSIGKSSGQWFYVNVTAPAQSKDLTFTTSGGSGGDPDLYIRLGADPTTGTSDCSKTQSGRDHSCVISSPTAGGVYHVGIYADGGSAFTGLTLNVTYVDNSSSGIGCSTSGGLGWRNCTRVTPTGRSEAAEKTNYATWYSYHRTRMKAAKAGASEAFSALTGSKYRVGYTTIWNRSTKYIPVATHNGLFEDVTGTAASTNRTDWFNRLHAATGSGRTPLQTALNRIGQYYSDATTGAKGASGPYGPATTNQLACRQNYALLTTDGYWNDGLVDVGNSDGTAGPNIGGSPTYSPSAPYQDSKSQTLADVAMEYWKKDLMPNMSNIVPASTANPAFWQHMVTFGVSIGQKGTLPQTSVAQVLADGASSFTWPDPTDAEDEERIDDLLHAAVNGHGTFAIANNPEQFSQALQSALSEIIARENSGSNVTVTSTGLQSDTRAFVAKYKSGEWYGEVEAYPVTADGVQNTLSWRATTNLPTTQRSNIYTLGSSNGGLVTTFPTSTQETTLTTAIANYVKGNRTGEGTVYRRRTHLLGDIVNSSPTYVRETVGTTVVETVYIGSNDGMLHAFNASNGTELFNYVPNLINMTTLKGLSALTNFEHHYFVDGPVVVSNRRQTPGKNYLVGSLGRGGKGVYGLDVSDPSTFASTGKAWEFAGDNDMGMVLGKPLIAKLNNGDMAAIIPNGINSTSEHSVLYIVNLTTGAQIKKIDTFRTGDALNNGLSAPTGVDTDGNGTVDYVYAGDLNGNVWKFDLSGIASSSWGVYGTTAAPIYSAKDGSGNAQPVTGGITVSFNPYTFEPWVFFGTGRYITAGDKDDLSVQTWYGMVDSGATGRSQLKARDIVVAGVITDASTGIDRTVRSFEKATTGDMSGKKGWYIDLLTPPNDVADGERMVGNQVVVGGSVLVASSIIPQSSDCDVTGKGFVNAVDLFTGSAVSNPFFDADGNGEFNLSDMLTSGTGTGATKIPVGSIDLGVGMPTDPTVLENLVVVGGSKGTTGSVKIKRLVQDGRISWREIIKD